MFIRVSGKMETVCAKESALPSSRAKIEPDTNTAQIAVTVYKTTIYSIRKLE
jgi:hypothetical protein